MPDRPFLFEVYRLNIVDQDMLPFVGRIISNDSEILRILSFATDSRFDETTASKRGTFKWSLREFVSYELGEPLPAPTVIGVTLARSVISQSGVTVTEKSIEDAMSELSPPPANIVHLIFYMARHLVAIEYNSALMHTHLWRSSLHSILDSSAHALEFQSLLRLEPVPREEEVMQVFRSFQRITRLRVRLRMPNPELDRRTERLRKELVAGGIRDYNQDMRNPRGLSQSEENLPAATAAMAQAGYKEGDVVMSGYRDGRFTTVRTGNRAARGRIDGLKDFIRGIGTNARAKETRNVVSSILEEVDRIAETPVPPQDER
jgi:hypothetical protein